MSLKHFLFRYIRTTILFLGVFGALIFSNNAFGQSQTFNSSGTFTVPDKVTSISVQVWGGGGGGGYNPNNGGRNAAGGGGGGYTQINSLAVTPGTIPFSIGLGGQGAINPFSTNSTNGGTTTFGSLSATGGNKGNGPTGGLGGVGSGGTFNRSGGNSPNSGNANSEGGTGGGAAGNSASNGANGNSQSGATGGNGGNGINGAGNGGNGGNNNSSGTNGAFPGGGGGGAGDSGANGGNGGDGQIIVSWTCSNTLIAAPQPACINLPITPIEYDIAGATGATFSGLPAGVIGSYVTGDVTISGTPTVSGSFTYTITPTGSCTSASATGTIVVSPDRTAGTISSSTFCIDSLLPAGVTQATTGATGIGVPINLPTGITASWASNTITFSGTPTVAGSYIYDIPLIGGCGSVNATGTITINPNNTVSAASSNPTLCIDTPLLTNITFATTGASGIGTATNLPAGVTASWAADIITISGTPTQSGTFNYSVPLIGCGGVTATGTITVTPKNTASAASSSPIVCINPAVPISITHTTTGATGIGAWTGLPAGVTAAWSGDVITVSGTPTASGVFNYSIPLTGGCAVGAQPATGTITVNAEAAILTPSLAGQTKCIGQPFGQISVGIGQGLTYQWYSNDTQDYVTPTLLAGFTSNTYSPLSSTVGSTYYYVVVTSATCGTTSTSLPSGEFKVNPLPVVTFDSQPAVGNYCVDTDITYTTQSGQSNYIWTIPGTAGTDYSIISGGTSTSNTVVIRWLTPGGKSISVNYTDPNGCGNPTAATSNSITVQKNTVTASSDPNPSSCFINRTITPFSQTTTLATGISNAGVSGANGLPLGLSATWAGGTITISGTVDATVLPGVYNYSIPLTGGCGTVAATGFIDVQPEYTLTKIASISPSNTGGNATITLTGNPTVITDGAYVVNYQMGLANPLGATNVTVNFVNGVGTFFSSTINNESLTSLTINTIKKVTDKCPVDIITNNITFFGIQPKIFDSNGTFYVPAGIFQITVKVYAGGGGGGKGSNGAGGGGGGYSEQTINVIPGEPIGIFVGTGGAGQTGAPAAENGGPSYVTRDSSDPDPFSSSIAYAYGGIGANGGTLGIGGIGQTTNGNQGNIPTAGAGGQGGKGGGADGGVGGLGGISGNAAAKVGKAGKPFGGGGGGSYSNSDGGNGASGYIIITYPLPPVNSCFVVIDDGSKSGTTVIEYLCDEIWEAPEGLTEFTVYVGSGGGGGGGGEGSGGGGSGSLIVQTFTTSDPYGLPVGTDFTIGVGQGGPGAGAIDQPGIPGDPSTFTGSIDGNPVIINVPGGGGGGSSQQNPGGDGASGGGGGATPDPAKSFGIGGAIIPITYTGPSVVVYQGNVGGLGDYSEPQNSVAGGGGGGLIPWGNGNDGQNGKAAGNGQGEGGRGGDGVVLTLGDSIRYYGAGGGGIGEFFNGTEKIGEGGLAGGVRIGGNGNLDILNTLGIGLPGRDKTGSGGGAGYNGGGKGGNGAVYIIYLNYRILPVEFLYFNATYQRSDRSGELNWTTAQEWETSHFEIERSINGASNWKKVGEVTGKGYSDTQVNYSFNDENLPASGGNIYYRLKQVDMKGDFAYSLTRAIQVEAVDGSTSWIAYPNPSALRSSISVDLLDKSGYADEAILIRISDARGIFETYSVSSPEEVSAVVNSYLDQARPGLHILQLIWGNKSEQLKLIRK